MRSLDHLNILSKDVTANKKFFDQTLGFQLREHIMFNKSQK
ncbi:VOC family protein [Klebsiella pneumoniae]